MASSVTEAWSHDESSGGRSVTGVHGGGGAWEANYKIIDQPVRERVTASIYIYILIKTRRPVVCASQYYVHVLTQARTMQREIECVCVCVYVSEKERKREPIPDSSELCWSHNR